MSSISSASHIFQETLQTAIYNVNCLDEIPARLDGPCIQASTPTVHYQVNYNTNFKDRNAFKTSRAKSMEEAQHHSVLNDILEKGHEFAITLYTWRTIAVSLPQPQSNDDPDRDGIYVSIYKVLEPAIAKLREFMQFINNATAKFCDEVRRSSLVDRKNDSINEAYLLTLGKMLRMFALLDRMKLMSSGIRNDLSYFRRAHQYLRTPGVDVLSMMEVEQDSQELSKFVAEQYNITRLLQTSIHPIAHYEDLLADIISTCANMYEQKRYVLPDEKHRLVIIIAYALQLLENTPQTMNKDKREVKEKDLITLSKMTKKINVPKIDKILKECKTINLYGDMFIDPFDYVILMPSYSHDKWVECNSGRISVQGALLDQMPRFREEYSNLLAELTVQSNMMAIHGCDSNKPSSILEQRHIADTALKGLQRLSGWTLSVLETFTWKLANPTNNHLNADCPKEAGHYEKVTQYNYTQQEKFALIEMISMIKSAQAIMLRMESFYSEAIRRTVYVQMQYFVQHTLQDPLKKAKKKKGNEIIFRLIDDIQIICSDMSDARESAFQNLSVSSGGSNKGTLSKKAAKQMAAAEGAAGMLSMATEVSRNVGPSSTQLYTLRNMLESMLDRSGGKHTLRRDLDPATLTAVDDFYRQTFYWPYLLNYTDTLRQCGDLSQLWYREFFINMSKDEIQFPIEMSIPWILISHILNTEDPAHMEYLLYPLDLYNDAAHCALYRFKRQHLYDEIEAETNLVFEQLVYKLSSLIFQHFKSRAASLLLDKRFRAECSKLGNSLHHMPTYPRSNRYVSLLHQRNVEVLGRSIDLNRLITVKINEKLLNSLKLAIAKFRSGSITGVVELESTLECNRLCHRLLSELMDLDDFDDLLGEANNQISSPIGTIAEHIFWEVNCELVPHYCYNGSTNRFVRTVYSFATKLERNSPPEDTELQLTWGSRNLTHSFEAIFKLYSGFLGTQHFAATARILGYEGIFILFREFLKVCGGMISTTILESLGLFMERMPCCNNSLNDYVLQGRCIGINSIKLYEHYYTSLTRVIQDPTIKTTVCQAFREVGNILLFCMLLEQNLSTEESIALKHKYPFLCVPEPFTAGPSTDRNGLPKPTGKELHAQLTQKYMKLKVANVMHELGNPKEIELTEKYSACLTQERLCVGLVLFPKILTELKVYLGDPLWHGQSSSSCASDTAAASHPSMLHNDCALEFHRIWSAIQFITCCIDLNEKHHMTIEQLFGEGLQWGGLAIIALLKQSRRFEAMDLGYHLIRVHRLETVPIYSGSQTGDGLPGANENQKMFLRRAVERLKRFQALNNQLFDILNKHLSMDAANDTSQEEIRHIGPPVFTE